MNNFLVINNFIVQKSNNIWKILDANSNMDREKFNGIIKYLISEGFYSEGEEVFVFRKNLNLLDQ